MFKNWKIARKLGFGFACLVAIQCVTTYVSWSGGEKVQLAAENANRASDLLASVLSTRIACRDYFLTKDKKHLPRADAAIAQCGELTQTLGLTLDGQQNHEAIDAIVQHYKIWETTWHDYKIFDQQTKTVDDAMLKNSQDAETQIAGIWRELNAELKSGPGAEGQRAGDKSSAARRTACIADADVAFRLAAIQLDARRAADKYRAGGEEEIGARCKQLLDDAFALATTFKPPVQDQAGRERADRLVAAFHALRDAFVKTAACQVSLNDAKTKMVATGAEIEKQATAIYRREGERRVAAGQQANLLVVVFAVAGIVAGVVLAMVITRLIVRPLKATIAMIEDIEDQGDLTRRLDASAKDEVCELAGCFNSFLAKMQGIIRSISENASTLSGSSIQLSATACQLASGAAETNTQSATVASAAEEMSTNMTNMAAATEQMAANIKSVASATEEMTASISEIARSAARAAEVATGASGLAEQSNAMISQLTSAAAEIGKVIEVIQDIAEQTNLLALNATIEAARAGEAGKGFAVVASEVKELARQAGGATEEIRKRIQAIQASSTEVATSIQQIRQVIQEVDEISRTIASAVEEQSITTRSIARNVTESSTAAETVSAGVTQTASASKEISQNILGVDHAAKQTAQGAQETQVAGTQLSHLAEQLQSLVGQFKA